MAPSLTVTTRARLAHFTPSQPLVWYPAVCCHGHGGGAQDGERLPDLSGVGRTGFRGRVMWRKGTTVRLRGLHRATASGPLTTPDHPSCSSPTLRSRRRSGHVAYRRSRETIVATYLAG